MRHFFYYITVLLALAIFLSFACLANKADLETKHLSKEELKRFEIIQRVPDTDALRDMALFTFAIMSDNKGNAIEDKLIAHAVSQMDDLGAHFVIGLGDNLEDKNNKKYNDTFLSFAAKNKFWLENFWPNVADGENEYFGTGQGDWGAGRGILEFFGIPERPDVVMALAEHPLKQPASYYAPITINGITVHLIQLTFADTPKGKPLLAFRKSTRAFMEKTLRSIEKNGDDIIIIGAHSEKGKWIYLLNDERKKLVLEKCDLALSATTHDYKRIDHGAANVLALNTGYCLNKPPSSGDADPGWIAVYVFDDPLCLMTMYCNPDRSEMTLQPEDGWWESGQENHLTFIKFIKSGNIVHVNFLHGTEKI